MSAFTAARLAEDRATKLFAAALADRPAPAGSPPLTRASPDASRTGDHAVEGARRTCPGDSTTAYSHKPHC
jgi:hypothetical protein